MFRSKVSKFLDKIPVSSIVNGYKIKGIDKYFDVIQHEYTRMMKHGSSKHVRTTKRAKTKTQRTEHPRREAIKKTGTPSELVTMTDAELDTWFNENDGRKLNLGSSDLFAYFFPSEIHTEIHQKFDIIDEHQIRYPRRDGKIININFTIEQSQNTALTPHEKIMAMMRTLILGAIAPTLKTYDVVVYPTKSKKDFKNTTSEKKLGPSNVNSGVTTIYFDSTTTNKTTVFRREELGKLLIHELVHNLEFDFGFNDIDNITDLHKYFNVPRGSKILLNEAYTETVAVIINAIICCIEGGKTLVSLEKFLKLELMFNLFQTAKILDFYGFSDANEINMPDDTLGRFNQETNVLSYFYLKTALLHNLSNFIDFVDNNSYNFCLSSPQTLKVQVEFIELILSSTRQEEFIRNLNDTMDYIRKNRETIPKDLSSTLRMTCVE